MTHAASNASPDDASPIPDTPGAPGDAPADGIRFLVEYRYENDLLTNLARLQSGRGPRLATTALGAALVLGGAAALVGTGAWGWLGICGIVLGIAFIRLAATMRHHIARRYIDAMEHDTSSFGNRYRRVAVSDAGVMVFAHDGRSRYYPLERLSRVLRDDLMSVLVFDDEGVVVPHDAYLRGSAAELDAFLARRGA